MTHRLLAPRWLIAHVAVLLAMVVGGALGWWQLDRAREIHADSMRPAANALEPPVPLDSILAPDDRLGSAAVGRTVTVEGSYDAQGQLLVPGEVVDGVPGYAVVTPLRTQDRAVVVVRGWVPADGDAPAPVPAPPTGDVTVTGWLRASDEPPPVGESLPGGQIGSVHLPSLVNLLPYPLRDLVVTRVAEDPPPTEPLVAIPAPETQTGGTWPVQNLFYALEWWVFGLAPLAMWVSAVRRRGTSPATRQETSPART